MDWSLILSLRKPISSKTILVSQIKKYRSHILARHKVIFGGVLDPLPLHLAATVDEFVSRPLNLTMDDTTASAICVMLVQLEEDGEAESSGEILDMKILPPRPTTGTLLKRVQQMPFTNATLPRATIPDGLDVRIQRICQPKPDVAYGYKFEAFTPAQRITQGATVRGVNLSKYSRPAKDLYWPFFVVEFKAPATGGNMYVAENQCAGGGTACLMASKTLQSLASEIDEPLALTESVAYSIAIDGVVAYLHIHWYDTKEQTYCLQRIRRYNLDLPKDIQNLQMHTRNIVDWGLGSRLEKIKAALDVIQAEEAKTKQSQTKRPGEPLSRPRSKRKPSKEKC